MGSRREPAAGSTCRQTGIIHHGQWHRFAVEPMDMATQRTSDSPLATSAQFLKGVGPDRAQRLAKLELFTASDLLFFFPRDYLDLSAHQTIDQLAAGRPASVVGRVVEIGHRVTASGSTIVGVLIEQQGQLLRGVWFNQPFMKDRLREGQTVMLSGQPKPQALGWEMSHPRVTLIDEGDTPPGTILPVYRLTEGIKQHQMRRIVQGVAERFAERVPEVFPSTYLRAHQLVPIAQALREVHIPSSMASLAAARRRLIYQELLVMQLALALRKQQLQVRQAAPVLPVTAEIDQRIRRLFPFSLTACQNRAIAEICRDMNRPLPMQRMLLGDVGTGKTAVAAYAMLLAVAHQTQVAIMAPTEVLAKQHLQTFGRLLQHGRVRMEYLSSAVTGGRRRQILDDLASGNVQILIGTHAVAGKDVRFPRLGLTVVDEQHKFGVRQRAGIRQAAIDPHQLVMTATPIPRTVAMTLYGDLELSVLRSRPPGRPAVHTYLADPSQRERWWEFFRGKLRSGQQGFVISPLLDDDEGDAVSAQAALENLANGELADFRLDLLHGRMSSEEKVMALERFQQGRTHVLVATTVVEVGIDVPNATVMTIEHGERFGLAQLHQLRGRVGRGTEPGYVTVFADPGRQEAQERLTAFAKTNDGFELAEIDFRLRGPGELFGTRQHGMPPLLVADLRRDGALLEEAREDARQLLATDPGLCDRDFARLRRMVLKRYGHALDLADVG